MSKRKFNLRIRGNNMDNFIFIEYYWRVFYERKN